MKNDKGFMAFLEETYDVIDGVEEQHIAEEVEQPKKTKKKVLKKKVIKKSDAVHTVENRLRTKLDSVGLNETVINDIVSTVLNGVSDIPLPTTQAKPAHVVEKVAPVQQEAPVQESISNRAGSILDGMPEVGGYGVPMMSETGSNTQPQAEVSDITSHASSLLF